MSCNSKFITRNSDFFYIYRCKLIIARYKLRTVRKKQKKQATCDITPPSWKARPCAVTVQGVGSRGGRGAGGGQESGEGDVGKNQGGDDCGRTVGRFRSRSSEARTQRTARTMSHSGVEGGRSHSEDLADNTDQGED